MTVLELMVELSKYPFSAEVSLDEGVTLLTIAKSAHPRNWEHAPETMQLVIGHRPAHAAPIARLRKSLVKLRSE